MKQSKIIDTFDTYHSPTKVSHWELSLVHASCIHDACFCLKTVPPFLPPSHSALTISLEPSYQCDLRHQPVECLPIYLKNCYPRDLTMQSHPHVPRQTHTSPKTYLSHKINVHSSTYMDKFMMKHTTQTIGGTQHKLQGVQNGEKYFKVQPIMNLQF